LEAVQEALAQPWGNPGRSSHSKGLEAVETILGCRQKLANLFQIKDSLRICFTSNATEALNLAIKGSLRPGDHAVCSSMEHNAVWRPLVALARKGISFSIARAEPDGTVTAESILKELRPNTRLVAVLHASNVSGTINPIQEIGEALQRKNCLFLVDAAQSAGILPIDVEAMQIDMLAFPGHKGLLGPQGTGGLYLREGILLSPLREGGTGSDSASDTIPEFMPDRFEAGTLNTPGIAGLGAGLEFLLSRGLVAVREQEQGLTQSLLEQLYQIPGVLLYGPPMGTPRAPVVSFRLQGKSCTQVGEDLESQFGIVSRTGLHCAYLAHEKLGTTRTGTVRFSLGPFTTSSHIQQAIDAVRHLAKT
jgi:cysteine desulfurase family protein